MIVPAPSLVPAIRDQLDQPAFSNWFNHLWSPSAIDGHDALFLASLLLGTSVKTVVEVGCASGFSTRLLAQLLDAGHGNRLSSFDVLDHYYADPEKPVGYLLKEAGPFANITPQVHTGRTSLDVRDHVEGKIDLCFIDAGHMHPWPTIDTLAVLPLMRPGGIIVHHDLQMFRDSTEHQSGPKILLDQTPPKDRLWFEQLLGSTRVKVLKTRRIDNNIFALRVPDDPLRLGRKLADGFALPWDTHVALRIDGSMAHRVADRLTSDYGPFASDLFKLGYGRAMKVTGAEGAPNLSLSPQYPF